MPKPENGSRPTIGQYDLIRTIPAYKYVCAALGEGSPHSVGGALRNNPFAPRIPCLRVVASNLFVGGFRGIIGGAGTQLWQSFGTNIGRSGGRMGPLQNERIRMLVLEGVGFGKFGKMI